MIKYKHTNNNDVNMRKLTFFNLFDLCYYVDSNIGKHYGISIGVGTKQLHLLLRNWDTSITMRSPKYDA